jgi:predicted phage terminase large subunit-like protein
MNLDKLKRARWKGRTDLYWLAREVLGYDRVKWEVHGPLIQTLQDFPEPTLEEKEKIDIVYSPREMQYRLPVRKHDSWLDTLPGKRRRLILDSRGIYKTTVNVICHSIQWILNDPDITILIVHAKQEVAEMILREIRQHFTHNKTFREIYPDYCPVNVNDKKFVKQQELTVPNRSNKTRKEPTIGLSSIDTAISGTHYDVIKFTDIVDLTNIGTLQQLTKVRETFGMYRNVLTEPRYWIDVEGTRYHFEDLYGKIIESEQAAAKRATETGKVYDPIWKIYVRGIYKRDTKGKPYTFTPEENEECDLLKDENGNYVSWYPERFPVEEMELERLDPVQGQWLFFCQRLNMPVNTEDAFFPPDLMQWKSKEDMRRVPIAYYTTTMDTAETTGEKADFTAIVTCGWDGMGRCYVVDIRHGRMYPDEQILHLFQVFKEWRPTTIRIEETGFVRGLKASIYRQQDLYGVYLPLDFIKRDNQNTKMERILNTLQPIYKRKDIYFSEEINCREKLIQEFSRFPKYKDDILDALSDQFQNREWFGRNLMRPTPEQLHREALARRQEGFPDPAKPRFLDDFYKSTGGL